MLKFRDNITGKIFKKNPADKDLYISPRKHHKFSKEFIDATKYLHKTFYEVSPSTLEKWIDDFSRDTHPEKELAIWLYIAKVYESVISKFSKDLEVRKSIFQILLQISTGMSPEEIIEDENFYKLKITKQDVKIIFNKYENIK